MSMAPWTLINTTTHGQVTVDQLPCDARLVTLDRLGGAKLRRRFGYAHHTEQRWHDGNDGDLVHVQPDADREPLQVSRTHPMVARWNARPGVAMYLMRSHDNHWRVGIAQLHVDAQSYEFGPARRAHEERAAEQWILDVFATEAEARAVERQTAQQFGITEHCFHRYRARLTMHGAQTGQEPEPHALLARYHRDPLVPFWTPTQRRQLGCRAWMDLAAHDLIPGWMEIPLDCRTAEPKWVGFTMRRTQYDGPMYEVVVPKHRHHVADGVVVRDNTGGN